MSFLSDAKIGLYFLFLVVDFFFSSSYLIYIFKNKCLGLTHDFIYLWKNNEMVDKMKKTSIFRLKYILLCKKMKRNPILKKGIFLCILSKSRNFWVKEICDMDKGQGMMYT